MARTRVEFLAAALTAVSAAAASAQTVGAPSDRPAGGVGMVSVPWTSNSFGPARGVRGIVVPAPYYPGGFYPGGYYPAAVYGFGYGFPFYPPQGNGVYGYKEGRGYTDAGVVSDFTASTTAGFAPVRPQYLSTAAARLTAAETGGLANARTALTVVLPAAGKLWADGKEQPGSDARYTLTAPVTNPDGSQTFKVKARWAAGGKDYEYTKDMTLAAGESKTLMVFGGQPVEPTTTSK
jgi:uncharacterized protein (TIGR03000 family)